MKLIIREWFLHFSFWLQNCNKLEQNLASVLNKFHNKSKALFKWPCISELDQWMTFKFPFYYFSSFCYSNTSSSSVYNPSSISHSNIRRYAYGWGFFFFFVFPHSSWKCKQWENHSTFSGILWHHSHIFLRRVLKNWYFLLWFGKIGFRNLSSVKKLVKWNFITLALPFSY